MSGGAPSSGLASRYTLCLRLFPAGERFRSYFLGSGDPQRRRGVVGKSLCVTVRSAMTERQVPSRDVVIRNEYL